MVSGGVPAWAGRRQQPLAHARAVHHVYTDGPPAQARAVHRVYMDGPVRCGNAGAVHSVSTDGPVRCSMGSHKYITVICMSLATCSAATI